MSKKRKPRTTEKITKNIQEARDLMKALMTSFHNLSDKDIGQVLNTVAIVDFLRSIADTKRMQGESIYDRMLRNKERLTALARMRLSITRDCQFPGNVNGRACHIAAGTSQWFEDGIMFTQGENPYEGFWGLYRNGKVAFAITARDIKPNETLDPNDFLFVKAEEVMKRILSKNIPLTPETLNDAVSTLKYLLESKNNDESIYQDYLCKRPWAFGGALYQEIQSHLALDDRNIPDFTAMRTGGSGRDIIEIKPPFTPLFTKGGSFSSAFNEAWLQAERYLDFIRLQHAYLFSKGLLFENPKVILILGYELTKPQLEELRRKERMNPAINIYTYDELLAVVKKTVKMLEDFTGQNTILSVQPSTP